MRSWMRAVPVLLVLLVLAGATVLSHRARATGDAALAQNCDVPLEEQLAFDDSMAASNGVGIVQPFAAAGNVAACSLAVRLAQPWFTYYSTELRQWDPVTLAPDPSTIALRSSFLDPSRVIWNGTSVRIDFDPPVVTKFLTGVAEPPRSSIAFSFAGRDPYHAHTVFFRRGGPAGMMPARVELPDGTLQALTGVHPVTTHVVCGGSAGSQDLCVLQSVMHTDAVLDTSIEEVVQKIRVPARVEASWIEIAMLPYAIAEQNGMMTVSIEDAAGELLPPIALPAPLASRDFWAYSYYLDSAHWLPSPRFDQPVTLVSSHDYWLHVRTRHAYWIHARTRQGNEPPDFVAGIGPMFTRGSGGGPWTPRLDVNLAFRLIGTASTVTAVTPPPAPRAAFALRVSPNPSTGAAFVEWRDANGPVRIDVLDAHGRRVGGGDGAGGSGQWLWSAPRMGDARAAGVYFVRATDGEGRVAVERLVRVH